MAKKEDKWIVEVTYTQLLLIKNAVGKFEPSNVFFNQQDKEETLKAINNAK